MEYLMFFQIYKFLAPAILAAFLLATCEAAAETPADGATLNGYVKDAETGETLVGATVFIVGTKKGAYTNKSGYFSISGIPAGERTVRISFIGYDKFEKQVKFSQGASVRKEFEISQKEIMQQEVVVSADKEVEKRQISISKVNIPVKQIKEIRIGGESDVFRSLQMLPGVLTSSQVSSGLYIRGGSPDQNLILLDGSTVYNPTHLFGFISTFNAEAIKDVELIKGGYPAEYGSRLSSVLNITQKDGNKNEFHGLGSLGLISSKLSLEGPVLDGSWFIGGRRTYFDLVKPILESDPDEPLPDIGFYDINAKVSQNIGRDNKVFLSGFMSRDDFIFDLSGIDMEMFMENRSGSARWTHIFGDNLFGVFNLTASRYNNGFSQEMSGYKISVENSINDYTAKGSLEWFASDQTTYKTGFEFTNYKFHYESNWTGEEQDVEEGESEGGLTNLKIHDWVYAYYAQANHQTSDLLSFQAGVRMNYWDLSDKLTIDPRLAVRYQFLENLAVKATWGMFHQYLRLAGNPDFSLFDTWLPTDNTVNAAEAQHYILSFETNPWEDIDLNFDLYYKDLKNLSEMRMNTLESDAVDEILYSGDGYAYGFEIFLQKRIGKFAGWLGYGFGFVNAKFDSINFGNEFHPKFDRRHDFKIVAQYELNEHWNFGATFQLQSGQPYTGASSRYQIMLPDQTQGLGQTVSLERYGLRLPPSHQMNVSATYKTTLFGLPLRTILDVYNLYNRRDILMRYYNTEEDLTTVEDVKLIPILPTISFEIEF